MKGENIKIYLLKVISLKVTVYRTITNIFLSNPKNQIEALKSNLKKKTGKKEKLKK